MVAEDVDFALEDVQNLSNWCNIEEKIHGSEKYFSEGRANDFSSHLFLKTLLGHAMNLVKKNLKKSKE